MLDIELHKNDITNYNPSKIKSKIMKAVVERKKNL